MVDILLFQIGYVNNNINEYLINNNYMLTSRVGQRTLSMNKS